MIDSEKCKRFSSNLQGERQWKHLVPLKKISIEMGDELAINVNKMLPKIIQFHSLSP